MTTVRDIITELRAHRSAKNIAGMARFGISAKNTLGIAIPFLRAYAKRLKNEYAHDAKRHELALQLWESGIHEARILAGLIDVPLLVTVRQADAWVRDFDSWDVCDQLCMNLLDKTAFAHQKAIAWTKCAGEFERRAGYALMASLASHDKKASNGSFAKFFPHIRAGATDERNYVKKAVNWALRGIGKRNAALRKQALKTAHEILFLHSKSAQWVANDAIRELKKKDALRSQKT